MIHPYPAAKTQVIHTHGDDRSIGLQHGEQCKDHARAGVATYFKHLWQHLLGIDDGPQNWRQAVSAPATWLLDPILVNRLIKQVPEFARARLEGISDSTNQSYRDLLTAFVLPDLLPVLQGWATKWRAGMYLVPKAPHVFGCSSFVSAGAQFLVGRNLDFPGVCFWDRYQVIQTTRKPGALRTIGFTTAGNPLAGITGINEAQVYLAVHQHYSPDVTTSGQLPFVIGERVLESARTLDEAIQIIAGSAVASSWAFVLADGKTRTAAVVERQPGKVGVRRLSSGRPLTHANFFQTEACRGRAFATSARMNWDNFYRNHRLQTLLQQADSGLDPQHAVQVISDHFDPFLKREKVANRCIGTAHNIKSMVIDPESMKLFLAEGDAPVQLRQYVEYDLGEILSGGTQPTGASYSGFRHQSENMRAAKESFVLSFVAYMNNDWQTALDCMQTSLAREWNIDAALISGILLLKLQRYPDAIDVLGQAWSDAKQWVAATPTQPVPPEYFDVALFLARAHQLSGSEVIAARLMAELGDDPRLEDSNIRRIATSGQRYKGKQVERLMPPYSIYAPVE